MNDTPDPALRFQEIEHKFVVDERFDLDRFGRALEALGPERTTAIEVLDTYYLIGPRRDRRFVVRHRYDAELHHLTLKTVEADPEVRREINLDLGHHAGDQRAEVDAFLEPLGIEWTGSIAKDLRVWYFADVEVVHYTATAASSAVRCVEFEALRKASLDQALETVRRYERATGFDRRTRSRRSLLQLLYPEVDELLG